MFIVQFLKKWPKIPKNENMFVYVDDTELFIHIFRTQEIDFLLLILKIKLFRYSSTIATVTTTTTTTACMTTTATVNNNRDNSNNNITRCT